MTAIYKIADDLTAVINAGSYSESITAVRSYLPTSTQEDLEDWVVAVAPVERVEENLERNAIQITHTIHVGIQKNIAYANKTLMDAATDLVEEIHAVVRRADMITYTNTRIKKVNQLTIADPELLRKGTFTSVLEVTILERDKLS